MSEKIRTFIAIPIGESVQKAAAEIQKELQTLFLDVKWVKPTQIHFTLKFLGDVEKDRIDTIALLMKKHLSAFESFSVELSEVGAFPNIRHPQIIWIGVNDKQGIIKNIAQILDHELGMLGFAKEEREFQAHATIGRVRSKKNIRVLSEKLAKLSMPKGITCPISKVILFKSTLSSAGPAYEELNSIALR